MSLPIVELESVMLTISKFISPVIECSDFTVVAEEIVDTYRAWFVPKNIMSLTSVFDGVSTVTLSLVS